MSHDEGGDSLRAARKAQWRGLAQLARDPSLFDEMSREFGSGVDEAPEMPSRRELLRLMGASFALAGVNGCSRAPKESIRPYAVQPKEVMPGVAVRYATAMTIDGYARGLIVESHEGRPTKIEGNPDHPMSLGATGVLEQASVLSLYDVDRINTITHYGEPATWDSLVTPLTSKPDAHDLRTGRGLAFLLEPTGSPLLADQVARIRKTLPEARIHFHGAMARNAIWEGARIALGRPLETQIDLRKADIALSLDADFLNRGPSALRLARHFADGRRLRGAGDAMNRLYVVEPSLTTTGASADHRLSLRARDLAAFAAALFYAIEEAFGRKHAALDAELTKLRAAVSMHDAWIRAVARDLVNHRERSAILVGDDAPAAVHALGHAINAALGNVGRTISYTESPILDAGEPSHDLAPLVDALHRGEVATLVIAGGNPAYTAYADYDFARAIGKVRNSVYLGDHENETAQAAHWRVPAAHFLESWGDARAADGTISLVQPLILPLAGGRTPSELLALFLGQSDLSPHDLLVEMWMRTRGRSDGDANAQFSIALDRGIALGSAFKALGPVAIDWESLRAALVPHALAAGGATSSTIAGDLELVFRADSPVYDGAMANNAWLQELPDPRTKLTWDNAALLSPRTAKTLGVNDGDVLRIDVKTAALGEPRAIEIPALIAPGHADDSIAIALGYGKTGNESVARGVGVNAYSLRTSQSPHFIPSIRVTKTGETRELAITQFHHSLEGRDDDIYLHTTLAAYRKNPGFARPADERKKSLYQSPAEPSPQWGMVIDLNACTGCSACVVACQAENNIPIVGKSGVLKRREMHWMRIDRYFIGAPEAPAMITQPMLCQHCEKAPCEYVCPVNATVHSADGLNQMVYNRCVGTRFCSNNCPYKVRRFNWFDYHSSGAERESLSLQYNPDVTVRARGVMEKCTYCVQRIREAEITAGVDRRTVGDGEIVTACAQACPSGAIAFGDIRNPKSTVAQWRANDRAFGVLNDLGNAPRTRYLARVRNPNPEIG